MHAVHGCSHATLSMTTSMGHLHRNRVVASNITRGTLRLSWQPRMAYHAWPLSLANAPAFGEVEPSPDRHGRARAQSELPPPGKAPAQLWWRCHGRAAARWGLGIGDWKSSTRKRRWRQQRRRRTWRRRWRFSSTCEKHKL